MAAQPLAVHVGVAPACQALGVSRATFYRRQRPTPGHQQPRPTPARALCASERAHVLDVLACPRFVDRAPAEVVATLLVEGQYLCAERTMYRILAANQPVRERRNQRSHPCYTKPELVATGPNQTWSWDITRLRGPKRWTSFYLYVLLDIFSRYVVGWMVADRENAALAATLIEETCLKQGIEPQVLTLHSDRGAPMTSKCTAQLLADLGVTRSLSRPQVSDDNPFSEAQFKTLKYHPGLPAGISASMALRNPADAERLLPMLERHIDIYGRPPRQMAADGSYANGRNLKAAKEKGVRDMAFHKKRGLKIEDMVRSRWVYRKLRNFRAGIEAGISCLKRAYGLARCTWKGLAHFKAYVWPRWWLTTWRSSHASSRHSPAHNRARYKTGRRPALDHVRILRRTPTATTTYYHVGKIPSLEIKNCTNPAPAACGQPKTPAKHPVYGRTLPSQGRAGSPIAYQRSNNSPVRRSRKVNMHNYNPADSHEESTFYRPVNFRV